LSVGMVDLQFMNQMVPEVLCHALVPLLRTTVGVRSYLLRLLLIQARCIGEPSQ
jgi:hypothetical protein